MPTRRARDSKGAPRRSAKAVPEVIVDFVFERGLFHVAVANISDHPAYRVQARFKPPFRGLGGSVEVSSLAMFRGIEFLAPHKRIETFLDTSGAYFARREPHRISVHVTYADAAGQEFVREIVHDLGIYEDIAYVVSPVETRGNVTPTTATGRGTHGRSPR